MYLLETSWNFTALGCVASRQRVDLEVLLDVLDHGLVVALDREAAQHEPVAVGVGLADMGALEVASNLSRTLTLVAGGQQEVLAALALVGSGVAHVRHVVEPEVVDDGQHVRRRFENDRDHSLVSSHMKR